MGKSLIVIAIFLSLALAEPKLLKDINNNFEALSTIHFGKSGNKMFFSRSTAEYGAELWVEEGGVVSLVKDINPGTADSSPFNFRAATFSGTEGVYFLADTAAEGIELWKSDGTEGGTVLVKDINPGVGDAFLAGVFPLSMEVIPGTNFMWFGANNGTGGNEPWMTDGTSGGTTLVTDLFPGATGSNPRDFFIIPSFFTIILFTAQTAATGREPYIMIAGGMPSILSDVNAGAPSSNPYGYSYNADQSKIVFVANTSAQGTEPWQTDLGSTGIVKDIDALPAYHTFMAGISQGTVFGRLSLTGGGFTSRVFLTDGTNGGTTELKTIDCLPGGYLAFIYSEFLKFFRVVNDKVVFPCSNISSSTAFAEPWVTDGTVAGTKMLKDIFPGEQGSQIGDMYPGNNRIIMPSNDGNSGFEPWTTDGSEMTLLTDFNPGEASSFESNSGLSGILSNSMGNASVLSLRKKKRMYGVLTDGIVATELFDDSDTTNTEDSNPAYFTPLGDNLIFVAIDPKKDDELYITDGTKRGTRLLKNIVKAGGSYGYGLVELRKRRSVVFAAESTGNGYEPWITNGTRRGTKLLKDIRAGSTGSINSVFSNTHRNKVYFIANDGTTGDELWVTNGRASGTKIVRDIRAGADGSDIAEFISFRGKAYFRANDGTNGPELWVVSGSNASLMSDINPGVVGSYPANFTKVGNKLFFTAADGTHGEELWVTDGTTVSMVKDIMPGATDSSPRYLTASGDILFFRADDGVNGAELWKSDGTAAGTVLVADIFPGVDDSTISSIFPFPGKRVLLSAESTSNNRELWIAGESGATLLKDIYVGVGGSSPSKFIKIPGRKRVYFTATSAEHGTELWVTNGKAGGTKLVKDIYPGTEGSTPNRLTLFKDMLIFSADNGVKGNEPWIIREP